MTMLYDLWAPRGGAINLNWSFPGSSSPAFHPGIAFPWKSFAEPKPTVEISRPHWYVWITKLFFQ